MKNILFTFLIISLVYGCTSSQKTINSNEIAPTNTSADTIKIVNEALEYEILIIEMGFDSWLVTQKPMWYYSNNTLAIKNQFYVTEWNQRVLQPSRYSPNLYEQQINYDPTVDYGIEVNYKLYMYFQFFQQKYNQKL